MKKVAFIITHYGLPVPSILGGGMEELMTNLLNENEKTNGDYRFYFYYPALNGKEKKDYDTNLSFKNSECISVKYNRFTTFFVKVANRILKALHLKRVFYRPYYREVFKKVKKLNPDAIIFEGYFDPTIKKFKKTFGKQKLSFHVHIQIPDKERIDKYFSNLISVSQFISDDWKNYLGSDAKINYLVLKNCVDEERFNKPISQDERNTLRNNFGYKKDDFVILYCGRIRESKGVWQLVQATLKLDNKFKLLIIGGLESAKNQTSPFMNQLKTIAKNNSNKIKFTGYIKNSELYRYYQLADCQVVPSIWEEAAGLVAIEGQMCGLPQIITKSGGMVEYVDHQNTVIIEKDKDLVKNLEKSIINLSLNTNLKKISAQNKDFACKFNKNSYYENFINIAKDFLFVED